MRSGQRKAEKPDSRGGKYLLMPHCLLASEAYRTASPRALKVLTAMCLKHNGFNNGRIGVSCRDLAEAIDSQDHGANLRAIGELVSRGLVVIEGDHAKGKRLAREYRLTFIPTETSSATHDYLHWQQGDAGSRRKCDPRNKGNKRVGETSTVRPVSVGETSTVRKQTVGETSTAETFNRENPPFFKSASVEESPAHIVASVSRPVRSTSKSAHNSNDLSSAAPDAEELRERAKALLASLGRGFQNKLATDANIPAGSLSKFLNYDAPLNDRARLRLTCAMPKTQAAAMAGGR